MRSLYNPGIPGKSKSRLIPFVCLSTIGSAKVDGVELAITYGDPHFYSKVGFGVITEQVVPAPLKLKYPEGWLAQSLVDGEIKPIAGKSYCVKELNKPDLW